IRKHTYVGMWVCLCILCVCVCVWYLVSTSIHVYAALITTVFNKFNVKGTFLPAICGVVRCCTTFFVYVNGALATRECQLHKPSIILQSNNLYRHHECLDDNKKVSFRYYKKSFKLDVRIDHEIAIARIAGHLQVRSTAHVENGQSCLSNVVSAFTGLDS